MDGYYDYHPLHQLDRHFVLGGYVGEETRVIGFQLAALTGLPVVDLDRHIEHQAGRSVWELIWTQGEDRYRQLEREHLRSLLAERPWSILTLGDGALIDEGNRLLVSTEATLTVLDLEFSTLYWRLKAHPRADKNFWHPLHQGPIERFEQIRPYYLERQPGFAAADHRIELRGRDRAKVVEELMAILTANA